MRHSGRAAAFARILIVLVAGRLSAAHAQHQPSVDDFLAPAYPFELVPAASADRIAWLSYEGGRRNVYTAAAPQFRPVS